MTARRLSEVSDDEMRALTGTTGVLCDTCRSTDHNTAGHTSEVCLHCGDSGMLYERFLAEWVPCRACRPEDWEAERRG